MLLEHPGPSPFYWVALSPGCHRERSLTARGRHPVYKATATVIAPHFKLSKSPFTLMHLKLPSFVMFLSVFSAIAAQASPGTKAIVEGRRKSSLSRGSVLIVYPAKANSEPPTHQPDIFTSDSYEDEE
ncbi:hypothetical protein ARMSODRAFT_577358 [Armillaria solidipes]|uniref:Uncharacterized protein n=1 Tax=Armillaria solidipes TaxID=1076256 RepID=A0A2H3BYX6_9AGAR|nr:hypothetical protein ARMSODRAFT_577358 [Armillaria solidipes]